MAKKKKVDSRFAFNAEKVFLAAGQPLESAIDFLLLSHITSVFNGVNN